MIKDRSKYYKEPFKLGAATLYESDLITKINNEHWKNFGDAATTDVRLKVGDFIDLSVNLTIVQMINFLDEIKKFKTIEEIHKYIEDITLEIAKELKLPDEKI
jgi:hypothetical protein